MPIDYSKWKDIEVSDDEDDTHPNIDTPSLFRWRHQARLERMAENKQKQEEIDANKKKSEDKIQNLAKKLGDASLAEEEKKKIEAEIAEVKKQEEDWRSKEQELEEQMRLQPWNVDTIGHEAFSSSRINKYSEKKAEPPKVSEEEDSQKMADFFEKYGDDIKKLGLLTDIKATQQYLVDNPHLSSDYSASYLTIEALNHAILEEEEEMMLISRQCVIIQYIIELAKSLRAKADNVNMIKTFFAKFGSADASYLKLYEEEVLAFQDRLRKRAKVKREEALREEDNDVDDKEQRIQASPGGLDPIEVFDSLPEVMRDAFESRDISRLQDIAMSMDKEVFSFHLDRCIKSGLWVPGGDDDEEENAAESEQ